MTLALHSDTSGRPRVRTTVGVPVGRRPRLSPEARASVRCQLALGACLAAFDAEVDCVRDISRDPGRLHLVTIRNPELLERYDALRSGQP